MWLAMRQVGYTVAFVMTNFRLALVRSLLKARWSYFVSQPVGNFINSMGTETIWVSTSFHAAALLIANSLQVLLYALLSVLVSWKVTVLALGSGAALFLALNTLIKKSRDAGEDQNNLMKSLSARLADFLNGIKPIKAMALESHMQGVVESETQDLNDAMKKGVWAAETLKIFQEPTLVLMIALFLYFSLAYTHQEFSSLLVMAFLFQRLLTRIHQVQQNYQATAAGDGAFESLNTTIASGESAKESLVGQKAPPALENGIVFREVDFFFGQNQILRKTNLTIPAGKITAIVGKSGAGKTTIADLITGLFEPDSGKITIDGIPLAEIHMQKWRARIGYVPQEMFLFHDTIRKNITFGDSFYSNQNIEDAMRAAGAWDFVRALPQGIETIVGERGSKLSGGQRQRLAIARALIRKPKLLIMDEVTTSLDPATESALCETIRTLKGKTTILAISHQIAIIQIADQVIRLVNGTVVSSSGAAFAEAEA